MAARRESRRPTSSDTPSCSSAPTTASFCAKGSSGQASRNDVSYCWLLSPWPKGRFWHKTATHEAQDFAPIGSLFGSDGSASGRDTGSLGMPSRRLMRGECYVVELHRPERPGIRAAYGPVESQARGSVHQVC